MEEKFDLVLSELNALSNSELFEVYNEYCNIENKESLRVYEMCEFDVVFWEYSRLELVEMVQNCDAFDTYDEYFSFDWDVMQFVVSGCYVSDLIDMEELTGYIVDNRDCLGCVEIDMILSEDE